MNDFDVEILADVLGLWHDSWRDTVHTAFRVRGHELRWVAESGAETVVDSLTCALMSLGIWADLRLDIGECPACRERGSKRGLARWVWLRTRGIPPWRHEQGTPWPNHDGGPDWILGEFPAAKRPCPACTVDGVPTGRESLDWATAIVQAMPRDVKPAPNADDWGNLGQALARADVSLTDQGDQRIREALAVLADRLQREADPPCPDCDGVARPADDNVPPCRPCSVGRCPVCGEVLRAGEPCSITLHGMTAPPEWTRSTGKDHRAGERRRTLGVLISAWLQGPKVLAGHPELGALVRDVADEIINAGRPPVGPIARIADAR